MNSATAAAVARADRDPSDSGASLAGDLARFGDQGFAFADLVEEDDRCLGGHAGMVRAVADVGERAVGEREDHSAVRIPWLLSMSARTTIDTRA